MGPLSSSVIQSFSHSSVGVKISFTKFIEQTIQNFSSFCSSDHTQPKTVAWIQGVCGSMCVWKRRGCSGWVCVGGRHSFLLCRNHSVTYFGLINLFWKSLYPFPLSACSQYPHLHHHPPSICVAMETSPCQVAPCWILPSMLAYSDIAWVNHSVTWSYEQVWMLNAELDPLLYDPPPQI